MNPIYSKKEVTLSINVSPKDLSFIEKTIRHINRSIKYPFFERLVFIDKSSNFGRYQKYEKKDLDKLIFLLSKIKKERIIDDFYLISEDDLSTEKIFKKYFSINNAGHKANNGSPIFQYLYAWENCKGDYVFHTDSDMLFNYNPQLGWIEKSIEIIENDERVIFTKCGSPSIAKNFFENLFGKNIKEDNLVKVSKAQSFSTRYFLMNKNRFEKILPLEIYKKGQPLEKSIFYTLEKKGFKTCNLSYSKYNWAIHPFSHDNNFIKYLDDIIWAVENNIYPYYRRKPAWNIYTKGKNINCWLKVIKEARNKII